MMSSPRGRTSAIASEPATFGTVSSTSGAHDLYTAPVSSTRLSRIWKAANCFCVLTTFPPAAFPPWSPSSCISPMNMLAEVPSLSAALFLFFIPQ